MNAVAIRVLVADDQMLARQGLRAFLRPQPDIQVVGEAATGREALAQAVALNPDVVLMDVMMPDGDGIEATRAIKEHCPKSQVLVITVHADAEVFQKAVQAGAVGFVLKDISPGNLANAIRAVHSGTTLINPSMARKMVEQLRSSGLSGRTGGGRSLPLSDREIQVLAAVARGLSDREIARQLYIAESTVKSHLRAIYQRLNLRNRAHGAAFAAEHQLLDAFPARKGPTSG